MRKTTLAALLAAVALLAGCSKAGTSTSTKPSISAAAVNQSAAPAVTPTADYGRNYLQAVAPVNAAIDKMTTALGALPASATGADVAKDTDPAADAIDAANERLLRTTWPAADVGDVKALVGATATVAADLRSVDGQNALSIADWGTRLAADSGKMAAAVSIVRADLGLPPASPASCGSAHCA